MTFKKEELPLKNDSKEEHLRTRVIFEKLKEKAINNEFLKEYEKDHFCMVLKLTKFKYGSWEDYSCCDSYKFKSIYLSYFFDIKGGSTYYKAKNGEICRVEPHEVQSDIKYLHKISDEWDLTIQKTNHKEQMLQLISAETRYELKKLSNLPEVISGYLRKGSHEFNYKKRAILLQSKYNYCLALEIFETLKPDDLILKINSIQIEFSEYSLFHILNRHYAQITKQYRTGKTYHNEDFHPRILSVQLKEIFKVIDKSKLLQGKSTKNIGFNQNGTDYTLWTSSQVKSVKNEGNIKYIRLDTFYPILDAFEKNKQFANSDLKKINDTLSVYVPK